MIPRRAMPADAPTLARLNAHVQDWHAAQYPETFFATPDPEGLVAYFHRRLAEPGCTAFLADDPALGYALCSLQARGFGLFTGDPAVAGGTDCRRPGSAPSWRRAGADAGRARSGGRVAG